MCPYVDVRKINVTCKTPQNNLIVVQVLQQNTEYDALQWHAAVRQHYSEERSTIASAAEQATRMSAERQGIGQWLSGLVLREGKVIMNSLASRSRLCTPNRCG